MSFKGYLTCICSYKEKNKKFNVAAVKDSNAPLSPQQGIQFYTQIKTVTSQWKAEDATLKSPAVTMPTMGR